MALRKKKPKAPELKRIDVQSGQFVANGKTYFIQNRLSLHRYVEYLKLSNELAFGTTFDQMNRTLNEIFKHANSGSDYFGAIHKIRELSFNQMNAIVNFASRGHSPVLRFCALFINAENEDLAKYDDRVVDLKIKDWTSESLNTDDFFFLAANFIPTFKDAFQDMHRQSANKKNQPQSQDNDSTTTGSKNTISSAADLP